MTKLLNDLLNAQQIITPVQTDTLSYNISVQSVGQLSSSWLCACLPLEGGTLWLCLHGQTGSGWVGLIRGGCFLSATSQYPHPTPPKKSQTRPRQHQKKNDPSTAVQSHSSSSSVSSLVNCCHLGLHLDVCLFLSARENRTNWKLQRELKQRLFNRYSASFSGACLMQFGTCRPKYNMA